jgi:hypothetical protein
MELRPPTGADCVWFQECMIESKGTPNPVATVARFTELTEEEAAALPSAEVWPLYHEALDRIMEGFPKPGKD